MSNLSIRLFSHHCWTSRRRPHVSKSKEKNQENPKIQFTHTWTIDWGNVHEKCVIIKCSALCRVAIIALSSPSWKRLSKCFHPSCFDKIFQSPLLTFLWSRHFLTSPSKEKKLSDLQNWIILSNWKWTNRPQKLIIRHHWRSNYQKTMKNSEKLDEFCWKYEQFQRQRK